MIALLNFVLYTLHILVSLFLILVVLLQQGKGADLSVFGGGASQAAFGARGAATVLHKATVIGFVLFVFTTLTIGVVQSRANSTIMSGVETSAPAEESEDLTAPAGGELPAEDAAVDATGAGEEATAAEASAESEAPEAEATEPMATSEEGQSEDGNAEGSSEG